MVVSPMSITSAPTLSSAARATAWNIGPVTRLSRPSTTARDPPRAMAHAPNAAA